uniref:Uncharacterized protein n=1 Tax=Ditylenchus dipsaci TaxID=166011 RepID=A0A915EEJ3_9BILA
MNSGVVRTILIASKKRKQEQELSWFGTAAAAMVVGVPDTAKRHTIKNQSVKVDEGTARQHKQTNHREIV